MRRLLAAVFLLFAAPAWAQSIGGGINNPATLPPDVAYLDVNQSWTKAQAGTPAVLTDGGTIAVDASRSNTYTLTLTGNSHTLANPTNVKAGQMLNFAISQDGPGSRTGFATGTNYKYSGGATPSWTTTASAKDILSCFADTTTTLNCSALLDVH